MKDVLENEDIDKWWTSNKENMSIQEKVNLIRDVIFFYVTILLNTAKQKQLSEGIMLDSLEEDIISNLYSLEGEQRLTKLVNQCKDTFWNHIEIFCIACVENFFGKKYFKN